MEIQAYREEIKLKLTGNLLECELDDSTLDMIINSALREVQRYINVSTFKTLPFSRCIDLNKYPELKINTVSNVYRSQGFTVAGTDGQPTANIDPMLATQWQLISGVGNLDRFQNYAYNYASWNTLNQIRNTTSTDMIFWYDKMKNQLYINISTNYPSDVTIEYIPRFDSVEEIISDYWIDIIMRLSVALTKVTLGRLRTRYTQQNAIWSQDGATLLEEGNAELNEIREKLNVSTNLIYPID